MSRLTLRLPESLHEQLSSEAEREGVSLNHYIVYTLTRGVTVTDLEAQKRAFERLANRYTAEEAERGLSSLLAARKSPAPKPKSSHRAPASRPGLPARLSRS